MVMSLIMKRTHHKLPAVSLRGPTKVKVGFPASESTAANIQKAIWNEFGTGHRSFRGNVADGFSAATVTGEGGIPERPFMRNAMKNNLAKYKRALRAGAKDVLMGTSSLTQVLNKLGIMAQGDIQQEITSLRDPPNAPSTIARKGSSNPLIDTGAMRQAVTWKLDD